MRGFYRELLLGKCLHSDRQYAYIYILRPPSGMSLRKRDALARCLTDPVWRGWAHVSSRRHLSSPDLSSESVFATPRVFAGPVFSKCLRLPTCLHHATCLHRTCLWKASALAHVSSQRHVSSPDLSSRSVFACPCVFAPRKCLPPCGFTAGSAWARQVF